MTKPRRIMDQKIKRTNVYSIKIVLVFAVKTNPKKAALVHIFTPDIYLYDPIRKFYSFEPRTPFKFAIRDADARLVFVVQCNQLPVKKFQPIFFCPFL